MAADVLLHNVTKDTVGTDFAIRVIGSQIPPTMMTVQVAIKGTAKVHIQGRLHRTAPWEDLCEPRTKSGLFYIPPIGALRAVSVETGADSSVSVWATWAA